MRYWPILAMIGGGGILAIWATIWATCDTARLGRPASGDPADRGAWPVCALARGGPVGPVALRSGALYGLPAASDACLSPVPVVVMVRVVVVVTVTR